MKDDVYISIDTWKLYAEYHFWNVYAWGRGTFLVTSSREILSNTIFQIALGLSTYALLRRKSRKRKRGVVKSGDLGGQDDIVDVACVRSPSSMNYFDRRFNDSLELYNAAWLFCPAFVERSPKRNKKQCIVPKWTVRCNVTVLDPCRWNAPAVSGNSVIFVLPKSYRFFVLFEHPGKTLNWIEEPRNIVREIAKNYYE